MRRSTRLALSGLIGTALLTATGCQTTTSYFLSTIGLQKKPLAVALVVDQQPGELVQAFNPFARYRPLQDALTAELGRPVAIDPCFAFQAQQGLESGWYGIAVVTPTQYARLSRSAGYRIVAVPADTEGRLKRSAVLVVPADSDIRRPGDLRGKVVAFGPRDDARTHHAALQLLADAGLRKTDLSLEPLPIPGSLKHMPDAKSIAQTVLNQSSAAGFMDEAAWEELPLTAESDDQPGRDRLRVIAHTVALPSRLLVASPKLETAMVDRLRTLLVGMAIDHPDALKPLEVSRYVVPGDEDVRAARELAVGDLPHPAEEPPSSDQAADEQPL